MNNEIVQYKTEKGDQITLSPKIVRQYLVNGNGNISDQEIQMFMQLCKYQGLNPFLREIFLIKYGNSPATMVTGKEAFTKRAERHPDYRGQEAGIYVVTNEGKVQERKGTMMLPGERVIGGWAKVYRDGYQVPIEATVSFEEFAGRKNDGSLNSMWSTKPGTMIRKIALVSALREAFPAEFGGMYDADEINTIDSSTLPRAEITPDDPTIIEHGPDYKVTNDAEPEPMPPKMGSKSRPIEITDEPEQREFVCEECGMVITEKVAKFSQKKFGRILCMADQKKHT